MGLILSAGTPQFISDLILPSGTTFPAGTTELLSPDGAFTLEDLRVSTELQAKMTAGDVRLFSNINEVTKIGNLGYNDIESFGGVINQDVFVKAALSGTSISATTYYGDGSNLSGISTSDYFVTGGTFNESTDTLELTRSDAVQVDVSLSALTTQSIKYFNGYDNGGGTTASITNTWVDIPLDTQRFADSDYSHSVVTNNQEVTIQTDGTYLLLGNVGTKASGSNKRSQGESRLVLDNGGGYVQVDGTIGQLYNRQSNFGASASFVTPLTLSAGDKVKLQYRRVTGSAPLVLQSNSSALTIVNIKGPKGEKGDTGSTTGLTHDIQEMYKTNTTSTISTTPVDLDSMTITTKDLGGPATYTVNFSASRSNSVSNATNFFYINVNGVNVIQQRMQTFANEIHTVTAFAKVTGITSNDIIKIQYDASGGGTNTVYERMIAVNGILDANVV